MIEEFKRTKIEILTIQEYLNRRKEIKSYRLGGLGEGGVGATVVYFK